MAHKQPFEEAWREFVQAHAEEAGQLTPEQIAERTGYSLATVKDHFERQRREEERQAAERRRREQEAGAVIYTTSSGQARVVYYPVIGVANVESNYARDRERGFQARGGNRDSYNYGVSLGPQDVIEIGIYLLGLQPHVRDVLARGEHEPALHEPEPRW